MTPYAGIEYFLLILGLVAIMVIISAVRKGLGPIWLAVVTASVIVIQYNTPLEITPTMWVPELVAVIVFGLYQWGLIRFALKYKPWRKATLLIPLSLIPILIAKYMPLVMPHWQFGFAGISYVTFRSLDVIWSITDGVLAEAGAMDLFVFLFFFPTISSGPIDRFRRFRTEFRKTRTHAEVLADLDAGVPFVFRGLLYKYVIATLIEQHIMSHAKYGTYLHGTIYYAYTYSAHLFFDFAGYSAFAVGVSRWFGIRSPENFKMPWAAPNIKEFWNRWHISLSTWFRDHVYMRFVLTASKKKWFKSREITASAGYFVSFGLMGIWHGLTWYYILYGFYHATLLAGYDAWARWRKRHPERFTAPAWKYVAHFLTINAVVFGLWLFSGHGYLTKEPPPPAIVD